MSTGNNQPENINHSSKNDMKQFYAIAGLCLAAAQVYAQPQIQRSNLYENFVGALLRSAADGFDPGTTGADKTWDYSALTLQSTGAVVYSPSPGTPYASTFFQANFTHHYVGSFNETWHYYKVSDDKIELHAEIFPGIFAANYTPNPKTIIEFPYTFNRTYTDTYKIVGEPEVAFTATYDAYGTLILPFGTFHNVIRQKIVTNGQADYIWYNIEPFYPLLQTSLENNLLGLMQNSTLGQAEFQDTALSVYPNPAQDVVNIHFEDPQIQKLMLEVYDLTGKMILAKTANANTAIVPTAGFASGFYLLKVTDQNGRTYSQKFSKV